MQADSKTVLNLLKTARGQLDGVIRMVEEDRYCIDISNQLMAIESLVAKTNATVLKAHVEGCVRVRRRLHPGREAPRDRGRHRQAVEVAKGAPAGAPVCDEAIPRSRGRGAA